MIRFPVLICYRSSKLTMDRQCLFLSLFKAAEKALKAAHYMVDADKTDTHDLIQNANRLDDPELRSLATHLGNLLGIQVMRLFAS